MKKILFIFLLIFCLVGSSQAAQISLNTSVDSSLDGNPFDSSGEDLRLTLFGNWVDQGLMNTEIYGKFISTLSLVGATTFTITFADGTTKTLDLSSFTWDYDYGDLINTPTLLTIEAVEAGDFDWRGDHDFSGANSVTIGPLSMPSLSVYADNAAAITGGLAAGDLYRTSAGVLMVVYTP